MQDPLSIEIEGAGVETTLPLLPEGNYNLQIAESILKPNKDQTGLNWHMKLVTTEVTTATDGRTVNPNFPVFMDIGCQPGKDSTDPDAFKRNLFATVDAVFGTDKTSRPTFNHALVESAVGKVVVGRIIISKWESLENNKVKSLQKAA